MLNKLTGPYLKIPKIYSDPFTGREFHSRYARRLSYTDSTGGTVRAEHDECFGDGKHANAVQQARNQARHTLYVQTYGEDSLIKE